MTGGDDGWRVRPTPQLQTERLVLDPLRLQDAAELVSVLADSALYTFIGGQPPTLDRLTERCRHLLAGPGEPGEQWHNWVIRLRGAAVGTLQGTVTDRGRAVNLAWVIGTPWQGRGFAVEAARELAGWFAANGVLRLVAHIHPDHAASAGVARSCGLTPSGRFDDDGEQIWQAPPLACPESAGTLAG